MPNRNAYHNAYHNAIPALRYQSLKMQPAITAAIFLHAHHYGLSSTESGRHPKGKWSLQDRSLIGPDKRTDMVVARLNSTVGKEPDPVALVCEAKTYHVCCSKGIGINGNSQNSMPVLPELRRWFRQYGDVPLLPAGQSEDQTDFDGYYPEPWQRKIQRFMFQVCWMNLVFRLLLIVAVLAADGAVLRAARRSIQ